jgi:secreted PhoX family phosphatase
MIVALSASVAVANSFTGKGPMRFDPIAGSAYGQGSASWVTPFVVPDGFEQEMVSDETVLDIYAGTDDLTDMNTVNETGRKKGRYLYRTHEVGANGSVSVVDLKTGVAKVLVQDPGWRRLDGIRWTPWGTLLFAEETTGGRLFEAFFDRNDPTEVVDIRVRPALGIMAHEGIEALKDGTAFVIDELTGGGIFKFVPDKKRDLSEGTLYAAKGTNADGTGDLTWVPLDRNAVKVDARAAHAALAAQGLVSSYERPEDVEVIGDHLYVAVTGSDRVLEFDLKAGTISNFVQAGVNVPVENQAAQVTGFNSPDNLAEGADRRLWIVEDNDFSDIYATDSDRNKDGVADGVHLFASLKDVGGEGTGIYFGQDPRTLFVNVQHPDKALADGTWKISRTG